MQTNTTFKALFAVAVLVTWAAAAPYSNPSMNNTAENSTVNSSSSSLRQFEFSYNCSNMDLPDINQTNRTYLDLAIGLNVFRTYSRNVWFDLNATITDADRESFIPCYPAPINTRVLLENEPRESETEVQHVAAWYGVLAEYARYTAALLEDEGSMPPDSEKKVTTVLEMLDSLLTLLTDVIGPYSCEDDSEIDIGTYEYTDHPCTQSFDTLKFSANMVNYLQDIVANTRKVQRNWYSAAGIGEYLSLELRRQLRKDWIARHTSSC